jgi:DNA-binding CsgD family transcriptional regulator
MTQGDNEPAMSYFDECLQLAAALDDQSARAFVLQFRGSAEQFKGNLSQAESLLSDSVGLHRSAGLVNSLTVLGVAQLAFVSCLIGNLDRAIELCDECRATSEPHGERWALSWAPWVCGLARWTQGKFREAAVALGASLEVKHALNDRLGMSACVELLALVSLEEGKALHACQLLGASRTLWASVGSPLFGSAALLETHDRYEERTRQALGRKAFDQGYLRGGQLKTEEAVVLAGADMEGAFESGAESPDRARLTPRETEVANLVAEGLTNKEIADRLVISQRTAEGHVERVLDKMGFKSRTQVAACIARQESVR